MSTTSAGLAQESDSVRVQVQDDVERALEDIDPEDLQPDSDRLTAVLLDLAENPVNINETGIDRLMQVPGMNLKKARAVIRYREEIKLFESIGELVEVAGIGPVTLERMRPYVTVGTGAARKQTFTSKIRKWTKEGRFENITRFQQNLQEREGYRRDDTTGYLGSPVKYYHRLRYRSSRLSVNLTQEKDAGEPLSGPAGFDFTSWHIGLQNAGRLKMLVAGDYSMAFGQGLVLWNGGFFRKGRNTVGSVAKNGRGIRPYGSSDEVNRFTGWAFTYGGKIRASGFYSATDRDATVAAGDTVRLSVAAGYHRTRTEVAKKDNLNQVIYGGRVRAELPVGIVGATGYRAVFDAFIQPGPEAYNIQRFNGRKASMVGVDYTLPVGPAVLFGEGARSRNGGFGFILGLESPLDTRTEIVVTYRNYAKDFQSLFGSGFGEQSGEPRNEEGVYIGLEHRLSPKVRFSGYFDQFRFPSARFGSSRPSQGYDWLGLVEFRPDRNLRFYLQGKSEVKNKDYRITDPLGRELLRLGTFMRSSLRAHLELRVDRNIRLRTRGEIVRVRPAGKTVEYGYLIYQDLRIRPFPRWSIDTRITVFETESYDSRVYQFENDLLYLFSNSMLYEQGQRYYLLVHGEPLNFLEFWAKFGITVFENRQLIGSGLDEIRGHKTSDIGVQLRIRF